MPKSPVCSPRVLLGDFGNEALVSLLVHYDAVDICGDFPTEIGPRFDPECLLESENDEPNQKPAGFEGLAAVIPVDRRVFAGVLGRIIIIYWGRRSRSGSMTE